MSKTYTLILFLFVLAALGVGIVLLQNRHQEMASSRSTHMSPSPTVLPATPTLNPMATDAPVQQIALAVTTPPDKATVSTPTITVSGTTVPNADVIIDDVETTANSLGKFSARLTLDVGDNPIVVVANDVNGNYSEKDLTVSYIPTSNQ